MTHRWSSTHSKLAIFISHLARKLGIPALLESFRALSPLKKISLRSIALTGVLSFLIIQLNIYFAWTSHVGAAVGAGARGFSGSASSPPLRAFLVGEVDDIVKIQFGIPGLSSFFTNLASKSAYDGGGNFFGGGGAFNGGGGHPGNGFFGGGLFFGAASDPMKYFIDAEVVVFTLAVFLISVLLFRRKGIGIALLRAFEITSLAILPLGLEIFFFDGFEFNVHASDIQVLAGLGWFTNADVLILSSAVLGMAAFVEAWRYANRKSDARPDRSGVRGFPLREPS